MGLSTSGCACVALLIFASSAVSAAGSGATDHEERSQAEDTHEGRHILQSVPGALGNLAVGSTPLLGGTAPAPGPSTESGGTVNALTPLPSPLPPPPLPLQTPAAPDAALSPPPVGAPPPPPAPTFSLLRPPPSPRLLQLLKRSPPPVGSPVSPPPQAASPEASSSGLNNMLGQSNPPAENQPPSLPQQFPPPGVAAAGLSGDVGQASSPPPSAGSQQPPAPSSLGTGGSLNSSPLGVTTSAAPQLQPGAASLTAEQPPPPAVSNPPESYSSPTPPFQQLLLRPPPQAASTPPPPQAGIQSPPKIVMQPPMQIAVMPPQEVFSSKPIASMEVKLPPPPNSPIPFAGPAEQPTPQGSPRPAVSPTGQPPRAPVLPPPPAELASQPLAGLTAEPPPQGALQPLQPSMHPPPARFAAAPLAGLVAQPPPQATKPPVNSATGPPPQHMNLPSPAKFASAPLVGLAVQPPKAAKKPLVSPRSAPTPQRASKQPSARPTSVPLAGFAAQPPKQSVISPAAAAPPQPFYMPSPHRYAYAPRTEAPAPIQSSTPPPQEGAKAPLGQRSHSAVPRLAPAMLQPGHSNSAEQPSASFLQKLGPNAPNTQMSEGPTEVAQPSIFRPLHRPRPSQMPVSPMNGPHSAPSLPTPASLPSLRPGTPRRVPTSAPRQAEPPAREAPAPAPSAERASPPVHSASAPSPIVPTPKRGLPYPPSTLVSQQPEQGLHTLASAAAVPIPSAFSPMQMTTPSLSAPAHASTSAPVPLRAELANSPQNGSPATSPAGPAPRLAIVSPSQSLPLPSSLQAPAPSIAAQMPLQTSQGPTAPGPLLAAQNRPWPSQQPSVSVGNSLPTQADVPSQPAIAPFPAADLSAPQILAPMPLQAALAPLPVPQKAVLPVLKATTPRPTGPSPAEADQAPSPGHSGSVPAPGVHVANSPAPSPTERAQGPSRSPASVPVPAREQPLILGPRSIPSQSPGQHNAPGDAPGQAPLQHSSPGTAPGPAQLQHSAPGSAPGQAPLQHSIPGSAPGQAHANILAPRLAPGQAPQQLAPSTIPSQAPHQILSPSEAPGLAPALVLPRSAPGQGPASGVAAGLSPGQAPNQNLAPALTPLLGPSPHTATAPRSAPALSPGLAPMLGPEVHSPAQPSNSPLGSRSPLSEPAFSPLAAHAPGHAPGLTPLQAPGLAPALSTLPGGSPSVARAPGPTVALPLLGPSLEQAPATSPQTANAPQAAFAPISGLVPQMGPAAAQQLSSLYPASALPPAAPGQSSTLVTLPVAAQGSGVTAVDSTTGQVRSATPQDAGEGNTLVAAPGTVAFVVQTSQPMSQLPASAVGVQGGIVTSTSPVQGGNGKLFNVNVNTAKGASFVAVSTLAGAGLLASNTIKIQLDDQIPVVTITSGSGYNSGQTVTPAFTINFGERVKETDPRKLFSLTGASRTDVVYSYAAGRIYVTVYILPGQEAIAADIVITVPAGVTTDLAGHPNTAASYTYFYRPKSPSFTTVSHVANSVAGGAMGVALATPVAFSSVAATSGASAAAGSFCIVSILHGLQLFYLAGQMNVENLPSNFKQVADSFSYSVLNFRMPWENAHSNTVGQQAASGFPSNPQHITVPTPAGSTTASSQGRRLMGSEAPHRRLLQATSPASSPDGTRISNGTINLDLPSAVGGNSQYVVTSTGLNNTGSSSGGVDVTQLAHQVSNLALGNGSNPYETLYRALFWLGIGVVGITLLVWGIVALFLYLRWEVPVIFQAPRPQFMLLLFAVPAIAQASAQLFSGGRGKDIAVGVVVVVLLPFLVVLYGTYFIWRHIFHHQQRRAAWVLREDPELVEREASSWPSRVLDVVIGPKGAEGSWMALKRRDSRFVNQYGPLFEVNRGPPMVLTDVTYEVDPVTGHCNRGRLQQVYEDPLLKLGRFVLYPHHLQGYNTNVELLYLIATAIVLQSFSSPSSYAQVITLIVINLVLLFWLRIIRPNGDRTELIMAMIGCLSSLGTYICGLILLATPSGSPAFRDRIGIAMIVLGLWSVVTYVFAAIAVLVTTWSLWSRFRKWYNRAKDPASKFADVVFTVMEKDEHILARKFADRWMYRTLGVGLFGRKVHRCELANPRQRLYNAVTLINLQQRRLGLPRRKNSGKVLQPKAPKGSLPDPQPSAKLGGTSDAASKWPGLQQVAPLLHSADHSPLDSSSDAHNSPVNPRLYAHPTPASVLADEKAEFDICSEAAGLHKPKRHPAVSTAVSTPLSTRDNLDSISSVIPTPSRDNLAAIIANPFTRATTPSTPVSLDSDTRSSSPVQRRRRLPSREYSWARRAQTGDKENF